MLNKLLMIMIEQKNKKYNENREQNRSKIDIRWIKYPFGYFAQFQTIMDSHYSSTILIYLAILFIMMILIIPSIISYPPIIHYSHIMRILKIPYTTEPGTIVYR